MIFFFFFSDHIEVRGDEELEFFQDLLHGMLTCQLVRPPPSPKFFTPFPSPKTFLLSSSWRRKPPKYESSAQTSFPT